MLTVYSQQRLFVVYLKTKTETSELAAVFQNARHLLEGQAVNAIQCFRVPNRFIQNQGLLSLSQSSFRHDYSGMGNLPFSLVSVQLAVLGVFDRPHKAFTWYNLLGRCAHWCIVQSNLSLLCRSCFG